MKLTMVSVSSSRRSCSIGMKGTIPVPWQNITTLVSLFSETGGSPNGPRALILDKRIKQKRRSPGAHCPILNNTRHLSKWVHLDQNNSRLIWRQNDSSKANTLINSEKLPVVVALDRMEYCLGKMFMNEIYLIDYLVTGWPSSNWPLTTRCWPECLAEGHCFFRVNVFTEEVPLKLTSTNPCRTLLAFACLC